MARRKRRTSLKYRTVRAIVWPLNAAMAALDLLLSIPVLGRFTKWIWNIILSAGHFLVGMFEFGLMKAGIMADKQLQLGIVILRDEDSIPLAEASSFLPTIQETIDIFYEQARIRVVPIRPTPYEVNEAGHAIPDESWITINPQSSTGAMLDVNCNWGAIREDLWLTGALYQYLHTRRFLESSFRRLTGYGAPVMTIVVRKIHKHGGCSLGLLADYITLAYNVPSCLAHELGHACNLLHTEDKTNLMFPRCGARKLTPWQVAVLRSSRHVTYF